jgi:hypothetical protein
MKPEVQKKAQKKKEEKRVRLIKCEPFGNRCNIDGSYMEDGVCAHGHQAGESYPAG